MKPSFLKKSDSLLRSNFVKGAFLIAFFGFFAFVYAVTFPSDPEGLSGVVQTVVGETSSSGDGNDPNDYAGADLLCDVDYPGSSLCDYKDIVHTITTGDPTPFDSLSGNLWVNSGVSSGPNVIASDCNGWQDTGAGDVFGVVYNINEQQFELQDCRSSLPYACCQ